MPKGKVSPQAVHPSQSQYRGCDGCTVRGEMIEHYKMENQRLRDANDQLQNKLLAMAPPVVEAYQRLAMTQMASIRPQVANGVMPRNDLMPDPFDDAVDHIVGMSSGMGKYS